MWIGRDLGNWFRFEAAGLVLGRYLGDAPSHKKLFHPPSSPSALAL